MAAEGVGKGFYKGDALVAALLLVTIAACKYSIVNAPYYWDEMCAYVQPAHWLASGSLLRAFPGLHPAHTFYGHPFAIYLTLAALYKTLGSAIWVSHLFILAVSFIGVYYTYLLGKHLYDYRIGVVSALLLFFSPLFFAQSGMVNGDTVVTSLGVATLYYCLKDNYCLYLITSTLMVLSKESAAAFIVAILLYLLLVEKDRRHLTTKLLRYGLPLLFLAIFFIFQKATAGDFLPNKYFNDHSFFDEDILNKLRLVLEWSFVSQYKVVLIAAIAADIVVNKKQALKKEYILFGLISVFFVCTYTGIFFLVRYIMPILPYFFIAGAASLARLFQHKSVYSVAALGLLVLFTTKVHGSGDRYGSSETDMQYMDIVNTHRSACRYIETLPGKPKVFTNQPLLTDLSSPQLGYVNRPISVTSSPSDSFDILLYSRQTDQATAKELEKVINEKNMMLAKTFKQRGKAVDVYVNAQNEQNWIDLLPSFKQFELNGESKIVSSSQRGILLDCKSKDPRVVIPYRIDGKSTCRIKLVIESPTETYSQLYFKTSATSNYSEENSIKQPVLRGENTVFFNLKIDNGTGDIRIDPGAKEGRYLIKTLQISAI